MLEVLWTWDFLDGNGVDLQRSTSSAHRGPGDAVHMYPGLGTLGYQGFHVRTRALIRQSIMANAALHIREQMENKTDRCHFTSRNGVEDGGVHGTCGTTWNYNGGLAAAHGDHMLQQQSGW